MTVSTSPHSGTVKAVRNRVGKRGFSAYVEAALRRQIEQTTWPSWLMSTPAPSGTSPLRNSPPRERSCTVPRMLALGTLRDRHPRRTRSAWPPVRHRGSHRARRSCSHDLAHLRPSGSHVAMRGKRPRRQVLTLQATGTAVCWPCSAGGHEKPTARGDHHHPRCRLARARQALQIWLASWRRPTLAASAASRQTRNLRLETRKIFDRDHGTPVGGVGARG